MRVRMLILIIIILICIPPSAQAGKPGPTPYPQPEAVQVEAYPGPQAGLSEPAEPDEWCDGLNDFFCAYFNGIYVAWINHLGYNPDMQVILCTEQAMTWNSYCREMDFLRYDVYKDRNVYTAPPSKGECFNFHYEYEDGYWFRIVYAYAPEIPIYGAQYATLWEPNLFPIFCNYLPYSFRAMVP